MTKVGKFIAHVLVVGFAFILAYELRRALPLSWWLSDSDAIRVLGWAALYAAVAGIIELFSGAEKGAWRYVSAREVIALTRSMTATALVFLLVIFIVDRGFELPRSVLALAWLLSLLMLIALRLAWRVGHDRSLAKSFLPKIWRTGKQRGTPLLIVGAVSEADRHVRHLQADRASEYWSAGILSPNSQDQGVVLHEVPCLGSPDEIETVIERMGAEHGNRVGILFLRDPLVHYGFSAERVGQLRVLASALLRPASLLELRQGDPGSTMREMRVEEFLARAPVSLDPQPVCELLARRRVLVTGAGGSIGSEIARQLVRFGCDHVTLVDHSEFLLFEIDRELSAVRGGPSRRAVLANVRDLDRLNEVFRTERPDIVFHAAALKHVALVEDNPSEGVLTNVLGTRNVLEAASQAGVTQFVLISTDKAVAPTNVMGSTKRIAEALLDLVPQNEMRLCAVRFGNVLGSAGSVVPIFKRQIAAGGPVTVSHPDVDRYFMTIPEAVQLVLHSAVACSQAISIRPAKYILEMGEPVRILDLAKQMIELSGKRLGSEIEIEITGLKPGEKLSEALLDDDEKASPCVEGIMVVDTVSAELSVSPEDIESLVLTAFSRDEAATRARTFSLVERIRMGERSDSSQSETAASR